MRFKKGAEVREVTVDADQPLITLFDAVYDAFRVPRASSVTLVMKGGVKVDCDDADSRRCRDVAGLVDARSIAVLVRGAGACGGGEAVQSLAGVGVMSMEEEDRRLERRLDLSGARDPTMERPASEWTFQALEVLEWPTTPPPEEALKLLRKIAYAPGVVALMQQRRWSVLRLTELTPIGQVGVDPACLLGYNRGRGLEISLRLRTDDLRGFRNLAVINKTLYHELAHMEFDEHDIAFKELASEVAREAERLDWTKGRGRRTMDYALAEGALSGRVPDADEETIALLEAPGGVDLDIGGPAIGGAGEGRPSGGGRPRPTAPTREYAAARRAADAALMRLEGKSPPQPRQVLPYNPAGKPRPSAAADVEKEGTIAVGVRLGDGSRITASLPATATVGDVRRAVDEHVPRGGFKRPYVLSSPAPAPRQHADDESLVDAGLDGALLVQRFID